MGGERDEALGFVGRGWCVEPGDHDDDDDGGEHKTTRHDTTTTTTTTRLA